MRKFTYEIQGKDGAGRGFSVRGEFAHSGDFPSALVEAQRRAFFDLTQGRATYGQPGTGSCRGPYSFQKLVVETLD